MPVMCDVTGRARRVAMRRTAGIVVGALCGPGAGRGGRDDGVVVRRRRGPHGRHLARGAGRRAYPVAAEQPAAGRGRRRAARPPLATRRRGSRRRSPGGRWTDRRRRPSRERPDASAAGRQRVGELLAGQQAARLRRSAAAGDVPLSGRVLREAALQPDDDAARRLRDRVDAAGTESYRYDAPRRSTPVPPTGGPCRSPATPPCWRCTGPPATRSAGSLLGRLGVDVDQVARGYSRDRAGRQPERAARPRPAGTGREESVCGGDQQPTRSATARPTRSPTPGRRRSPGC